MELSFTRHELILYVYFTKKIPCKLQTNSFHQMQLTTNRQQRRRPGNAGKCSLKWPV